MQGLDPQYNYFGLELGNTFWEDVNRCCIFPPDAAFRDAETECFDAEGKPIPTPEGEDGHVITLFWRMDVESEGRPPMRPKLHAILAAFAHLYSKSPYRRCQTVRLLMLRYVETPCGSDVPPVNFCLWHNMPRFLSSSFCLECVEGTEFEKTLPDDCPPCSEEAVEAAAAEWRELVCARLRYLVAAMRSAEDYEVLKPTLDEWCRYMWQLEGGYDVELEESINRLRFKPWYAEALRRMPGLNEMGLCSIPLPSIGRMALLDYRPEEARRFCCEVVGQNEGRLRLAGPGETPLPCDARTHLHLLPFACNDCPYDYVHIAGVPACIPFRESWLES